MTAERQRTEDEKQDQLDRIEGDVKNVKTRKRFCCPSDDLFRPRVENRKEPHSFGNEDQDDSSEYRFHRTADRSTPNERYKEYGRKNYLDLVEHEEDQATDA